MALIKCKECGQEVSSKASSCPNCGCPIEKGRICNECGQSVSSTDKVCPNCGNPLNTKGRKMIFVYGLISCVVISIVSFWGYTVVSNSSNLGNYTAEDSCNADNNIGNIVTASDTNAETYDEAQYLLEEKREREHKAIVGTYIFNPRMDNYASVDMYNGQKWWKEKKLVGYIEWTEYLVVMEDNRVSLLRPSRKNFVGTVSDINDGAFIISINSNENARVGAWTTLYRNGKDIGRLGDKGYGFPKNVVVDTKTKRIYNGVEDYKNRDISDVEYIMYDSFSSEIKEANNTGMRRNYLSEEYEREYGD